MKFATVNLNFFKFIVVVVVVKIRETVRQQIILKNA